MRWLLLTAVLAGLFGMHVLTAETSSGGHGALPHTLSSSATAGHEPAGDPTGAHSAVIDPAPVAAALAGPFMPGAALADPSPSTGHGGGHGGLGGCVLFLVIGGALVLLALLAARAVRDAGGAPAAAGTALTLLWRRGPPGGHRPRVALCVIRV